jgi:predicted lipid-binding transport protein (Tim44 family)
MKNLLMTLALAVGVVFTLAPADADAKRLGGARSSGMQRNAPDKPPPAAAPQNAATPAAAAAPGAGAAAAAAPKRSWMGPIAGLAAGLGLAALFSHLGLGAEMANFLMLALLAMGAFVLVRMFLLRRGAAAEPALQGASAGVRVPPVAAPTFVDERPTRQADGSIASAAPVLPEGFDAEGFERLARVLFIRMQAANDSADLDDLRNFTTPELYAALRLDLQDRGDAPQRTDVVNVKAQLIERAEEAGQQVVSVRYTGLLREEAGGEAAPFDEVWHLVKPLDDSRNWAIAGIQQRV